MSFDSINPSVSPSTMFPDGSKIIMESGKESKFGGCACKISQGREVSIDARALPDGRTILRVSETRQGMKPTSANFVLNNAGTRLTRLKSTGDTFWRNTTCQDAPKEFLSIVRKFFKGKIKI